MEDECPLLAFWQMGGASEKAFSGRQAAGRGESPKGPWWDQK